MTTVLAARPHAGPPVIGQATTVPAALLHPPMRMRGTVKVVVAGGLGAGKTSLVHAVSELTPVTVDVTVTDPAMAATRPATTSAIDFGRLRLRSRAGEVVVCLFGLPGLGRFWPGLWPDIATGALGAIVVVDPHDLVGCFGSIDHCEQVGLPVVVCLNRRDSMPSYTAEQVRAALRVDEAVPVGSCDVRARRPATTVVASLVEHALTTRKRPAVAIHSG